jgi:sodium pump decarboxylase gamma subunit
MEQESLAFAGIVTILGMGVVFFFLALLSLGMVGLRRMYGGPGRGAAPTPAAADAGPTAATAPARHDARWVAAAVAAWLAEQGQFDEVSAAPWDPLRRRR